MRILPWLVLLATLIVGSQISLDQAFPIKEAPVPERQITTQEAYASICAVASRTPTPFGAMTGSTASGIILTNGNVLTAAHVVDHNGNRKLDPDERVIDVSVFGSETWVKADVIAIAGEEIDLALVRPQVDILTDQIKGIPLAANDATLGDPVMLIGRRLTLPASITRGVANPTVEPGMRMVSASSWFGGSGGGAFNADNKVIGVVISIGRDSRTTRFRIPIPIEGGVIMAVSVRFQYEMAVPNMAFYVPLVEVKRFLTDHDSMPQPQPAPEPERVPNPYRKWFYYYITAPLTGFLGFLLCLGAYRAYRSSRRR